MIFEGSKPETWKWNFYC